MFKCPALSINSSMTLSSYIWHNFQTKAVGFSLNNIITEFSVLYLYRISSGTEGLLLYDIENRRMSLTRS